MEKKRNRYREMERYLTYAVLADAVLFVLYLMFAGLGFGWIKIIAAVLAIITSVLGVGYLHLTGEWMKLRSRWMTFGFAAIALVILVSLLVNYPSPDPLKQLLSDAPVV